MALVIKNVESKRTPSKKNIILKDVLVSQLSFVDTDGVDLTEDFKNEVPDGTDSIDIKISFELPDEE